MSPAELDALQEAPTTTLTGPPAALYAAAKARVAQWDPHPPTAAEEAAQ